MKYTIEKNVDEFWAWFYENSQNFGEKFDNRELLAELDSRITTLGPFSWEIGPGKFQENSLVISPNGDLEVLEYSKAVVEKAKQWPGWEFYYAKPPKKWELKFDYQVNEDRTVQIDASLWQYVLAEYEDGTFEIVIKLHPLLDLNDQDQLSVAEIVLDGILGEEMRMKLISFIEVVDEFEESYTRGINSITSLGEHLTSLR
jgi:hypothetical protein